MTDSFSDKDRIVAAGSPAESGLPVPAGSPEVSKSRGMVGVRLEQMNKELDVATYFKDFYSTVRDSEFSFDDYTKMRTEVTEKIYESMQNDETFNHVLLLLTRLSESDAKSDSYRIGTDICENIEAMLSRNSFEIDEFDLNLFRDIKNSFGIDDSEIVLN